MNNLTVTKGQLIYEFDHLYKKLIQRKSGNAGEIRNILYADVAITTKHVNPLFTVIDGPIEPWEKQT
jgi:hypothetical protein